MFKEMCNTFISINWRLHFKTAQLCLSKTTQMVLESFWMSKQRSLAFSSYDYDKDEQTLKLFQFLIFDFWFRILDFGF